MPSRSRKGRLKLMFAKLHVKQVNSTTTIALLLRFCWTPHSSPSNSPAAQMLLRGQTFATAQLTSGDLIGIHKLDAMCGALPLISATPSLPTVAS